MVSNGNTGFCIPYTVRDTSDKGQGIFVDTAIPKGTILWRHLKGQYAVYDESSLKGYLANLTRSEVVYELEHMFGVPEFSDYIIRVFDDGVLINHSRQPTVEINNGSGDSGNPYNGSTANVQDVMAALLSDHFALIATQDLDVGDELTHDYTIGIEDPAYYDDLCVQHDVSSPWLD